MKSRSYLTKQALENPSGFLTLLGKVLPLQLSADPAGGNITIEIVKFGDSPGALTAPHAGDPSWPPVN
jgi:hypothetical protein